MMRVFSTRALQFVWTAAKERSQSEVELALISIWDVQEMPPAKTRFSALGDVLRILRSPDREDLAQVWPWSDRSVLAVGGVGIGSRTVEWLIAHGYRRSFAATQRLNGSLSAHDQIEQLNRALNRREAPTADLHSERISVRITAGQKFLLELVARNRKEEVGSIMREAIALLLDTTDLEGSE